MVSWINALSKFGNATAFIHDGRITTYNELESHIDSFTRSIIDMFSYEGEIEQFRPLILLFIDNSVFSISTYLACLKHNWPVMLVNPSMSKPGQDKLIKEFEPNLIIRDGEMMVSQLAFHSMESSLALLLMTSGSTGGGKAVALSHRAIEANTSSICEYLPIKSDDIALLTMPLSYSYGLSILHTHLSVGASLAFTKYTMMDKPFWSFLENTPITSLSGVPSWYEMMFRLRFEQTKLARLRYVTQAGGKLATPVLNKIGEYCEACSVQFFRMYGQTEATARMAWLSPDLALSKKDGIGKAIPGGELFLQSADGHVIDNKFVVGELCYRGDNCMLGYVENAKELYQFNSPDYLATGDLAMRDQDGDYRLCGRLKRIVKLAGERCNLDGLEALFSDQGLNVKCVGTDTFITIFCLDSPSIIGEFARECLSISPRFYNIRCIDMWPVLANGKTDYPALTTLAESPTNSERDG